jgi:hypothetical protein
MTYFLIETLMQKPKCNFWVLGAGQSVLLMSPISSFSDFSIGTPRAAEASRRAARYSIYNVKKVADFPVPKSRDVMSLTKLSLVGNIQA